MFDVPILIINFNRPAKTKKILEILKVLKPQRIYFSIDGPRKDKKNDKIKINQVKKLIDSISWSCSIKKKISKKNLGLKFNVINSINWFFNHEIYGIILEDDCIPSLDFFSFSEEMLKRYKKNKKIMQINGSNLLNNSSKIKETYFFSKLNSTWGWASWRRAWKKFNLSFKDYEKNIRNKKILNYYNDKKIFNWIKKYFDASISGKDNIWSIYWTYQIFYNDGLIIAPTKNYIDNLGFDGSGTSGEYKKFKNLITSHKSKKIKIVHPKKIVHNLDLDLSQFKTIKKVDRRAQNIFEKIYYRFV